MLLPYPEKKNSACCCARNVGTLINWFECCWVNHDVAGFIWLAKICFNLVKIESFHKEQ